MLKIDFKGQFRYNKIERKNKGVGLMKIYNTFEKNTSKLRKLFLKVSNTISKPAANSMVLVVNGTINSNSIITDFIAEKMESLKELKPDSINILE